jgi:hypothetical protein
LRGEFGFIGEKSLDWFKKTCIHLRSVGQRGRERERD